jgi:hypothetical protein
LNDNELRELARFIADLKINKQWTEEKMFELFQKKPDIAEKWKITFEKLRKTMREEVQFT